MVQGWDEVERWRREQRRGLVARRQATLPNERRSAPGGALPATHASAHRDLLAVPGRDRLPRAGPPPLDAGCARRPPGRRREGRPLEFWAWRPGAALRRGIWDIPIPAERQVVQPTALLVPLVGFDGHHYRLGYGGGYYDRTLAGAGPEAAHDRGRLRARASRDHPPAGARHPHGRDRDGGGRRDHVDRDEFPINIPDKRFATCYALGMEARDFRSIGRAAQEELRRRALVLIEQQGLSQAAGGRGGRRAAADGQHLAAALPRAGRGRRARRAAGVAAPGQGAA